MSNLSLQPGPVEKYLLKRSRKGTMVAALIDPDEFTPQKAGERAKTCQQVGCSLILVGGSTVGDTQKLDSVVKSVKHQVTLPVVLFPGNVSGVSKHADAILFSSLLNSTNPYFLIGAQALGASPVFRYHLEAIPMGYLVFGSASTTAFIGDIKPIPPQKPELAIIYSLAAGFLGMRTVYLEAGSGSNDTMSPEVVKLVRRHYSGMVIVGGGITDAAKANALTKAGAHILVVGNLLEKDGFEKPLREIARSTRSFRP